MDRGAWQATVIGVARVEHDLATKPPPPNTENSSLISPGSPPTFTKVSPLLSRARPVVQCSGYIFRTLS